MVQPSIPSPDPTASAYQMETARSSPVLIPWVRETEEMTCSPPVSQWPRRQSSEESSGPLLSPHAPHWGPSPAESPFLPSPHKLSIPTTHSTLKPLSSA